jgi:glycine/D-amino acid oxidase-like deaminating enzyme
VNLGGPSTATITPAPPVLERESMKRIVIVGGGIMGSCIAYHLALAGAAADVVVIEPDPTYEFAATPRAVGGIRLQHALFENVEMSLYGDSVYSDFANQVTGGNVQYDPQFYRIGYLYMVQGAAQVATLASVADMLESKECGYTGSTGQRCAAATPHSISTTRMPER